MQKTLLIFLFTIFASTCYSQEKSRKIRVVGNSRIAKFLARINKEDTYAITFGKTIFVSCKREEFFAKDWWVKHELAHVEQYEKLGIGRFLSLYLYYEAFHRGSENPFEKEAEAAEYSKEQFPVNSQTQQGG